jgi:hypothetical protein
MDAQAIADMAPRPRAPAPPYDPNWRVKAEGDARRAQAEMDRKALEAMMPPKK